ncbi:hypothetical protein [Sphingomonas sp.]|uniref:hypothetical protein n=1 Tax=Sphingomonas sp. TaxID=28214 RepID=UPI0025FD5D96|nr:hypothetical protein [Sphingomonas sp.]
MTDDLVGRLRNRAELETKCGNRTESPLNAAALASAPAGDGVEDASDDGPCTDCYDTGVTIQTERPCSCGAAALARPRAAVGEQNREAIARLIWNDRHPTGASWDDWERHIAANGGFDGRDSCRRLADRILALQSPPAKVEGQA